MYEIKNNSMLSKACEYGIKAMIYLAGTSQEGQRVSLNLVAQHIESPEAFTSKILQKLAKAKVVKSVKGAKGGFELNGSTSKEIFLWDIVVAIDGTAIRDDCFLGLNYCSRSNPCPVHDKYEKIRDDIMSFLMKTSVHDLSLTVQEGKSFLS